MTDMALPGSRTVDVASDAAKARIKARYRAEARYKFYGVAAIGMTALFLVIVLADIVIKGTPAFTQHRLQLDVNIDAAEIDPKGTLDPAVILAGDFQLLARNAMRAQFPQVTERADRRKLDALLSAGATDRLRTEVVANPALVGQSVKASLLLSADADLYYKGIGTSITRRDGRGAATPSGTSGEVTIVGSANDFTADMTTVKQAMANRAATLRKEADRLRPFVKDLENRKAELERSLATARTANDPRQVATAESALKTNEDGIRDLGSRVADLDTQAAALQGRFDSTGTAQALSDTLPSVLVSLNGGMVKATEISHDRIVGTVLLPLRSAEVAPVGSWKVVTYLTPESNRRLGDQEVTWLEHLRARDTVESVFNWAFFTSGDSREPELAGIRGALVGSALTLLITLALCLPIGVAGAIYLEEFAPKNWLTEIIEVNINNLAAVPSIVFGLLGLAVFLNFMGLPRSAPLVGGLVLALLVLPTIIISARAALKSVPPSIKEAALGVGASHQQAIFHHMLPPAMPGIMTGTIIGMAHALGETAPLLMIGMVAFIVEVPSGIREAATVLPVQIYLWSDLPEIAFQAKTAAAIMVLLGFLFLMNGTAIYLRKRFERRW